MALDDEDPQRDATSVPVSTAAAPTVIYSSVVEPLLCATTQQAGSSSFLFEKNHRPPRDTRWRTAYLVLMGLAIAGGIYAAVHRNAMVDFFADEPLDFPAMCPLVRGDGDHSSRLMMPANASRDSSVYGTPDVTAATGFSGSHCIDVTVALPWLGGSGAVLLGVLLTGMAMVSPRGVVIAPLALQILILCAAAFAALAYRLLLTGVACLVLLALELAVLVLRWQQIEVVMALLDLAGRALTANPGLAVVAWHLHAFHIVSLHFPLLAIGVAAYSNGSFVYNPQRIDGGRAQSRTDCVDSSQRHVPCCRWQMDRWVAPYLALLWLAVDLSSMLVYQIKLYTVAGAVAQWYFNIASPSTTMKGASVRGVTADGTAGCKGGGSGNGSSGPTSNSRITTFLHSALGPSLGSLCFASVAVPLGDTCRTFCRCCRRSQSGLRRLRPVGLGLGFMFSAVADCVTRFAPIHAALSGKGLLEAGRESTMLLLRNAMDPFCACWWLPPVLLRCSDLLLAAAWGLIVYLTCYATWRHRVGGPDEHVARAAGVTGTIAFLFAWVVLGFCSSLVLDIIDSLFVCFAVDRDMAQVSDAEVHSVFGKLPTVGPVVQQPDAILVHGGTPSCVEGPRTAEGHAANELPRPAALPPRHC